MEDNNSAFPWQVWILWPCSGSEFKTVYRELSRGRDGVCANHCGLSGREAHAAERAELPLSAQLIPDPWGVGKAKYTATETVEAAANAAHLLLLSATMLCKMLQHPQGGKDMWRTYCSFLSSCQSLMRARMKKKRGKAKTNARIQKGCKASNCLILS